MDFAATRLLMFAIDLIERFAVYMLLPAHALACYAAAI